MHFYCASNCNGKNYNMKILNCINSVILVMLLASVWLFVMDKVAAAAAIKTTKNGTCCKWS